MKNVVNQVNKQGGKPMDKTYKIYFKHDGCSMLLFKGLPLSAAVARRIKLLRDYKDWQGHIIITK